MVRIARATVADAAARLSMHDDAGALANEPSNSINTAPSLGVKGNPSVLVHVHLYRT